MVAGGFCATLVPAVAPVLASASAAVFAVLASFMHDVLSAPVRSPHLALARSYSALATSLRALPSSRGVLRYWATASESALVRATLASSTQTFFASPLWLSQAALACL